MGIGDFFKKVGESIKKETEKFKINLQRNKEIRIIKEKYLSQLSHSELVQIYKSAIRE